MFGIRERERKTQMRAYVKRQQRLNVPLQCHPLASEHCMMNGAIVLVFPASDSFRIMEAPDV